jgi:hypothetical protein
VGLPYILSLPSSILVLTLIQAQIAMMQIVMTLVQGSVRPRHTRTFLMRTTIMQVLHLQNLEACVGSCTPFM